MSGSNICYQQPAALVNVTSPSSLIVSNVTLASGSWEIYVQTSAGQSARSAAFLIQRVTGNSLDDYPYKTATINTVDPYGFFYRECTSFLAYRMNRDAGTTDPAHPSFTDTMGGHRWGNAGNWGSNAVALGYSVDASPTVGSIAQWNSDECPGCTVGHVAYVEAVHSDGSIDVSEYNYANDHAYGFRSTVRTAKRFIHIKASGMVSTFSGSPSSGQQLTTTFSYSGSGLTPNGTIQQWFQGPNGTSSATIQANGSGNVNWTYVYKCTDTPGTWYTWIVDPVKNYTSPKVTNTVSANPSCTPGSFSGSPSSGQQLTTTFSYSGSGLTPNGTIQQWFQGPSRTSSATIQANGSGNVSWTYVYKCTDTPGTWYTWIVDPVKGYTSSQVVNNVSKSPSCP
ncbi:MAG TPA: CHAP domain-containing protein [Bryobacteraceae bacterium]|nr:CHAP domain-containing protein [Bryobacteraceae bacterium]